MTFRLEPHFPLYYMYWESGDDWEMSQTCRGSKAAGREDPEVTTDVLDIHVGRMTALLDTPSDVDRPI